MKKEYKKPELLFDSFELSTNIATGCNKSLKVPIEFGGTTIFAPIISCAREPRGNEDTQFGYCYHNPDASNNLFTS